VATLVEQRKELRNEVAAYKCMVDELLEYLHSTKFNKYQDSSPNQLCNSVTVEDVIRRLEVQHFIDNITFEKETAL